LIAEGKGVYSSFTTFHSLVRLVSDLLGGHINPSRLTAFAIHIFEEKNGSGESVDLIPHLANISRNCLLQDLSLKDSVPSDWYEEKKLDKSDASKSNNNFISDQVDEGSLQTISVDASPINANMSSESAKSSNLSNENVNQIYNTKVFKYFLTSIPSVLAATFEGTIRQYSSKRLIATYHAAASEIISKISKSFVDDLSWPLVTDLSISGKKLNYLTQVVTYIAGIVLDEQNQMNLQTSFVNSFWKVNGVDSIISTVQTIWTFVSSIDNDDAMSSDDTKSLITSSHDLLERCLSILANLTHAKTLHGSMFTQNLTREKSKSSPDFFDAHRFLVKQRNLILPTIRMIWDSDYLLKCLTSDSGIKVSKSFFAILTHIITADGEAPTVSTSESVQPRDPSSLVDALLGRRLITPTVPDEGRISQLIDMVFRYFNIKIVSKPIC
jgi:hypothetical protein